MDQAATELGIAHLITWGGAWDRKLSDFGGNERAYQAEVEAYKIRHPGKDFIDGPHFEIEKGWVMARKYIARTKEFVSRDPVASGSPRGVWSQLEKATGKSREELQDFGWIVVQATPEPEPEPVSIVKVASARLDEHYDGEIRNSEWRPPSALAYALVMLGCFAVISYVIVFVL